MKKPRTFVQGLSFNPLITQLLTLHQTQLFWLYKDDFPHFRAGLVIQSFNQITIDTSLYPTLPVVQ